MLLAYIDPAVGSMLLQALAAMMLAGMVMGRRILMAPLEWFKGKSGSEAADSEITELSAEK